jgi:putative endonuclease
MSNASRRFVYVLRSLHDPESHYVGPTADVRRRLAWHNAGQSPHTSKHKPWTLVVALEFQDQRLATEFERYLKSGSGRAFAKEHFS